MKVSVVMPVYNTRRDLLERAIGSVLSQTEQSFELIVVDDGSNQETAAALDEIAARDTRIAVYHQQNQGGGGFPARYDGIAKAIGEYVYVPDSDDVLHPRLLEYCIWAAENKGVEFLAFRFTKIHDGASIDIPDLQDFNNTPLFVVDGTSNAEAFKAALPLVHVDNWAQFATRELMQSLPPRKVSDLTRTFRLIKCARRWAATPLQLYFYDTGISESVTHKKYALEQITCLHKDLLELCNLYEEERKANNPMWEAICRDFVLGSVKIAYNAIRKRRLCDEKKLYLESFAAMLYDLFMVNNIPLRNLKPKYVLPYMLIMLVWRRRKTGKYYVLNLTCRASKRMFRRLGVRFPSGKYHLCKESTFEPPCHITSCIESKDEVHVGAFTGLQGSRGEGILTNAIIGRYCSIAKHAKLWLGQHPTNWLSSCSRQYFKDALMWHVYTNKPMMHLESFPDAGPTEIGNDVWIGNGACIMGGIKIGDGAIVATNAVVTKDVPPYAIVGGVPAKVIRYRFDEGTIAKLRALRWWDYDIADFGNVNWANIDSATKAIKDKINRGEVLPYKPKLVTARDMLPYSTRCLFFAEISQCCVRIKLLGLWVLHWVRNPNCSPSTTILDKSADGVSA